MNYTLLYTENGVTKDISSFVTRIQFGGDMETAVRKLEVSLISGTDVYIPTLDINNGGLLTLFSDEKELIQAVIFKRDRSHNGDISVTAYTHGIYLTKNKDTAVYNNVTATQIVKDICNRFNIPCGEVTDTGFIIQNLVLKEKTLWDMIGISLNKTFLNNNKKYRVFFKEGKLNICEKSKVYVPLILEQGTNLISAGSSVSIEELKNRIKVTGNIPEKASEIGIVGKAEDAERQKLYGVLQESRESSESDLDKVADNLLKELCKEQIEADVEAIGIDDVEAGMAVYVIEPVTGISGSYYIQSDNHTIEGNKHTMSLKLTLTDEVAPVEYDGGGAA